DENELAVRGARIGRGAGPDDDILREAQGGVRLARSSDSDGSRVRFHDIDRDALEVGAVSNARLDTERLELSGDVLFGDSSAACSRRPAFKKVGRKKAQGRVDFLGTDPALGAVCLRGRRRR